MNTIINGNAKRKVLLVSPYGPDEKKWGADMYDVLASRLARDNGAFAMTSHLHAFALYVIAENLSHPTTVLELPHWDEFAAEVKKGYDVIAIGFKSYQNEKVVRMMKEIRSASPKTVIVMGGYGVGMLQDGVPNDPTGAAKFIRENADYLCREEGVRYMRRLLGDTPFDRPITQYHVPAGSFNLPQLFFKVRVPSILVSLGCPAACDFCNTSAFFHHKKIYVAEPQQVYDFMKNHQKKNGDAYQVFALFDEDLFLNPEYVRELGRLIRSDKKTWGFRYFAFGSIGALSKFEPQELRENGLGIVWIGVESGIQTDNTVIPSAEAQAKAEAEAKSHEGHSKTGYKKRDGAKSAPEVFKGLQDHGIATIASMILGFDFHTRENLKPDIDYFVSLKPTFYQIGVLTPCPGTKLYKKLVEDDRIMEHFSWEDIHLWKADVFKVKNFEPNELKEYFDYAHHSLFTRNGPPLIQLYELSLRAHKTLKDSESEFLRYQAESGLSLAKVINLLSGWIIDHAPSPEVKERVKELDRQFEALGITDSILSKLPRELIRNAINVLLDGAAPVFDQGRETVHFARWTYYNQPGRTEPLVVKAGSSAVRSALIDTLKKPVTALRFLDVNEIERKIKRMAGVSLR